MLCSRCGQEDPSGAILCSRCAAEAASPRHEAPPHYPRQPSDFIGRHREMGQLQAALEEVLAGEGRLVMLVGEPGIGKTRSVQELGAIAESRGARVLWGWCHESASVPPYWPWIILLSSLIQESTAERLASEMGPGAVDVAEVIPDLKERLPHLAPPPTLASPEQARFRLFHSIT